MKAVKVMLMLAVMVLFCGQAHATVKQLKVYKKAYPDVVKPKCAVCHVDKLPKKKDGQHELNAYGAKALETAEEPTVETYQAIGSHEDFEGVSAVGEEDAKDAVETQVEAVEEAAEEVAEEVEEK